MLADFAWRHRDKLTPLYLATLLLIAAALCRWLHLPAGWVLGSTWVAAVVIAGGAIWLQDREIEALYASIVAISSAGWFTLAFLAGIQRFVFTLWLFATITLALPWWTHRRVRRRVEVERSIEAWPVAAEIIPALEGSRVVSAVATRFGFSMRVEQTPGATGRDAREAAPAIESVLGLPPDSVDVEPDPDHARFFTVRVNQQDNLSESITWPGVIPSTVRDPIPIGIYRDGEEATLRLYTSDGARHTAIIGTVGSGKSGLINLLVATLAQMPDAELWGVDLKGGQELGRWRPAFARLATTVDEAAELVNRAVHLVEERGAAATSRVWRPDAGSPAIFLVCDEATVLLSHKGIRESMTSLALRSRSVGLGLILAAQDPTRAGFGATHLRDQLTNRVVFRVAAAKVPHALVSLPVRPAEVAAIPADRPGVCYIDAPGAQRVIAARVYYLDEETADRIADGRVPERPSTPEEPASGTVSGTVSGADPGETAGEATDEATDEATETGRWRASERLWAALLRAGPDGLHVSQLVRIASVGTISRLARDQARWVARPRRGYYALRPGAPASPETGADTGRGVTDTHSQRYA